MDNSPTPTLLLSANKYNIKYYYQRQADFEQEGDEEISGEDDQIQVASITRL